MCIRDRCSKEAESEAIYRADDSDYYSIDFNFLKDKEVPISPIKDKMDVDPSTSACKRQRSNPLEGANQILKLARKYDQRVQETRTAKGLEKRDDDDNCEVTRIGLTISEPVTKAAKLEYRQAPTLTLSELIPASFKPEAGAAASSNLHSSFRAERIEFVLMKRKLVATAPEDLEWDLPENELYDEVILAASAQFIEADLTHADALLWSSVGQTTGIGMFAMSTAKMDLVEQFRLLVRGFENEDYEFETFPKNSLLESYGLTLYAHKGSRPFRPETLVQVLRRSNPQLRGDLEIIECREFPMHHPTEKKRGVRIISLQADQAFLDSLHEFPPNYPFNASVVGGLYIRGGARRNPNLSLIHI